MLDLAPLPTTTLATRSRPHSPRGRAKLLPLRKASRATEAMYRAAAGVTAPRCMAGIAVAAILATALGIAGLPAAIPWVLAAGGFHFVGIVTRYALSPSYVRELHGEFGLALHPIVEPEEVEPEELRSSYLAILRTHEELRATLHEHEPVSAELRSLYRSCGDAVQLAGRTAVLGGPLRRFLDGRARASIAEDIVRLDTLADDAADPEAREMLRRASASRRREAEIHADVDTMYARMKARLEVVSATLATAVAAGLHLCTLGVDRSVNAHDALIEHIDALDEDLRFLEDTITADV